MEHVIQFGIHIDDEEIRRGVYKSATDRIVHDCSLEFQKIIFDNNRWGRAGVSEWTKDQFAEFLEKNREELIGRAAEILADKLRRSKAVREIAADIAQENL